MKGTIPLSELLLLIAAVSLSLAPPTPAQNSASNPVRGRYIVQLEESAVGVPPGHPKTPNRVRTLAAELARRYDMRVERTWGHALAGFEASGLTNQIALELARHPSVRRLSRDIAVPEPLSARTNCFAFNSPGFPGFPSDTRSPFDLDSPLQTITCGDPSSGCIDNWALDRIDQEHLPRNNTYRWTSGPYAVDVYVLDSGIDRHAEFQRPLTYLNNSNVYYGSGANFTVNSGDRPIPECEGCEFPSVNPNDDNSLYDEVGHGTMLASIIAGRTYGVAKNARIVPVKIVHRSRVGNSFPDPPVNGVEPWDNLASTSIAASWLIDGIDFIIQRVNQNATPAIINISGANSSQYYQDQVHCSGGGCSSGLVTILYDADILRDALVALFENPKVLQVVQSAGNGGQNACGLTFKGFVDPILEEQKLLVVGGTDYDDRLLDDPQTGVRSNTGACVDILAPAQFITGAALQSRSEGSYPAGQFPSGAFSRRAYCENSGTSFAAPLVAGAMALHLSVDPTLSATDLRERILEEDAARDVLVGDLKGSPNLLLQIPTPPLQTIEAPVSGINLPFGSTVTLEGWAVDEDFVELDVEYRHQGTSQWSLLGSVSSVSRPGICQSHSFLKSPSCPPAGANSLVGWRVTTPSLVVAGDYTARVIATDQNGRASVKERVFSIGSPPPTIVFEYPAEWQTLGFHNVYPAPAPAHTIKGWAVANASVGEIHATLQRSGPSEPVVSVPVAYGSYRSNPNLCQAYPDPNCPNVGWEIILNPVASGSYTLKVFATDTIGSQSSVTRHFTVDRVTTFLATEDATVFQYQPNYNATFPYNWTLYSHGSIYDAQRTFMKWNLQSIDATVQRATFRFHVNELSDPHTEQLALIANNSWTQTTITWNNAPQLNPVVEVPIFVGNFGLQEALVTPVVPGGTVVTLVLYTSSGLTGISSSEREAVPYLPPLPGPGWK